MFRKLFVVLLLMTTQMKLSGKPIHKPDLVQKINQVIASSHAKVGVGILGLDFKDRVVINDHGHYPMQSVFKFPLAMAVLQQVDAGNLRLEQKIHIPKEQLDTNTWSPMVRDFGYKDLDISIAELLVYTVSKSDNNGCDVLFHVAGGTARVNAFVHGLKIAGMNIVADEAGMKKGWMEQYRNWCRPSAMLQLASLFYHKNVLSTSGNDFLMKIMTESENSPHRIKGGLPDGAVVAHKTGTSNTNKKGLTAAINDVGIITLPNGKHVALVVFVSDFKGGVPRGEQIIASIARIVWDHYKKK